MNVLVIVTDYEKYNAVYEKTESIGSYPRYPFTVVMYDSKEKATKGLDAFRKAGFKAEIEAR